MNSWTATNRSKSSPFTQKGAITHKEILLFWSPLAATWLMMAVEGPFLTAIIARLGDAEANLAAWGVAFTLAVTVESPIIMIMSASTALARDREAYLRLRNFTQLLNLSLTAAMLVLVATPAFDVVAIDLIGLPQNIAELTHRALIILLPWPGAIGFRRFYQGLLIRRGETRKVAFGTVIRMSGMAGTALLLYFVTDWKGASIGAAAASAGVVLEGAITRVMARGAVQSLLSEPRLEENGHLTYRRITSFYYPLALTSVLTLAVHPMVTFFVGQSRLPLKSLAVLPVVNGLVFLFRSLGISYQEAGIALLGERSEHNRQIRSFAWLVGVGSVALFALVAFTPLVRLWYVHVSGLPTDLTQMAIVATQFFALIPLFEILLSYQRAVLVNSRRTMPITMATVFDLTAIIGTLFVTIKMLNFVGATAAALALVLGRIIGNSYLIPSRLSALRRLRDSAPGP